jgi:D-tyrosyl-tRNA(Tyr) deacylase
MRAVVQRVKSASVRVLDGPGAPYVSGEIGRGLLVLAGVMAGDGERDLDWMAHKLVNLRIFADADGKMNRSVLDVAGSVLVVSQFTICGDASKGCRPDFTAAARPKEAEPLYERLCERISEAGVPVARGVFRAMMEVALVNDGPVTIVLDSAPVARGGGS